jgi:hypothetical protein
MFMSLERMCRAQTTHILASRRLRPNYSMEFPVDDASLEIGTCTGCRQHRYHEGKLSKFSPYINHF